MKNGLVGLVVRILGATAALPACDTVTNNNYYGEGNTSNTSGYDCKKFCDNMLNVCCLENDGTDTDADYQDEVDKCLTGWGKDAEGCDIKCTFYFERWVGDEKDCLGLSDKEAKGRISGFLDCLSTKCDKTGCEYNTQNEEDSMESCLEQKYN